MFPFLTHEICFLLFSTEPAIESPSHGDGLGALSAILPDSTAGREDGTTVGKANRIQIVGDRNVRDHQLDALGHAGACEVGVVAWGQWAGLMDAAQVFRGGAAEG